ncbi:unnamed protein product [Rotaria magnacalcarata]|uniref:Uncharacterized protein n=1 Tax=Rotaria magnacalcarata TaxID=392030 RepID=A0A816SRL6_9BILA|nr:unnamed protein product [Rotaria magnacalcarata]CAF1398751.1 unnamed protein product [Rotaria magnacalcarata]CAF2090267.1 unnamed protein product [Rotaria magnacalcarata]CAF2108386.1 unnamed protein product [Rotaria magnacalcarata]CAF2124775.1 unnamed protein product [Rotaria magnacalcarata]
MSEYGAVPVGFTGEQNPSANTSIWTVPPDATSSSDRNFLMPNNDKGVPNDNAYPPPSAPDLGDLPPNYYDISIVPNNVVLHYNEVTPYTQPSSAQVERKSEGVVSFDPLVDKNPDQLWLYFMTYLNEKPSLTVNIHGYHVEHYTTYERRQAADGSYHTHAVHHTRNVTDFNINVDLAPYVTQQWWRVAVIPSKKAVAAGEVVLFRDALEQYTRSDKSIKEITCQKQVVGWNFQELQDKIKALIYSTGYRNHITITFPMGNHRISARSPSTLSRFSNSTLVRVLCVVSCLCIIFGPIYLCLRAAGSTRDQIVADYAMAAPIDTFLHFNAGVIANAAISRSQHSHIAYIG